MPSIRMVEQLPNRLLITRESARLLRPALQHATLDETRELELDFAGIDGMTPSFLDELLLVIGEVLGSKARDLAIVVKNPPTRLSSKFEAVGRSHQLVVVQDSDDRWTVTGAARTLDA